VAELQERMSAAEFTEWAAFARLNPFGPARADLRMANIMALMAEINRDRKRRSKPFSPAEFMLEFDPAAEPEPGPTPEEVYAKVRLWAAMAGAMKAKGDPGGGS